jgi:hypothetical protein
MIVVQLGLSRHCGLWCKVASPPESRKKGFIPMRYVFRFYFFLTTRWCPLMKSYQACEGFNFWKNLNQISLENPNA